MCIIVLQLISIWRWWKLARVKSTLMMSMWVSRRGLPSMAIRRSLPTFAMDFQRTNSRVPSNWRSPSNPRKIPGTSRNFRKS